jgi:hypothetical protein
MIDRTSISPEERGSWNPTRQSQGIGSTTLLKHPLEDVSPPSYPYRHYNCNEPMINPPLSHRAPVRVRG